jgi:RimJ/RimL family protein N-acetyltransferase
VFLKLEPDVYELHTMILPDGRGAGVIPAAHKAFGWMFEAGARELVTYAPEANRAAALMARRAGFEQIGVRPGAWEDGSDIKLFRLTRDRWTALQDKQEALPCP